jgi:NADH-quinone oxidoreductase subunit G
LRRNQLWENKMVRLKINGESVEVAEGTTILQASAQIHCKIPTLCYREGLSVYGGCRICVVEVKGRKDLPIACGTEVEEGMEVWTHSSIVREARKNIFQLLLANHPFDSSQNCLTCARNPTCELRKLAEEIGVEELKYEAVPRDQTPDLSSGSLEMNPARCISCGRCVRTCRELQHGGILTMSARGPATKVTTFLNKGLGHVDCVNCGQCLLACPTGAIQEVFAINQVLTELADPKKHVVVQTAPAVRVAIGEEFGCEPGVNLEKKMVTALKRLGFDGVFDTNFTADLTVVEESAEFLERLEHGGPLPQITSCCPGWVKFAEHHLADRLEHLSTCKSPQQMFGSLAKSYYAQRIGVPPERIVSVAVMPCTAKKFERCRDEMSQGGTCDVDYVLTTRELARMMIWNALDLPHLPDGDYDAPFGISTGAAAIFGASGGVMEAALRTAHEILTGRELETLELTPVRGLEGIKEATLEIEGRRIRVAVASGLENAWKLLQHLGDYDFIEVMACPGGCIGGGGQPLASGREVLSRRLSGLYKTDQKRCYRQSHKNPAILQLYKDFLQRPLSEVSHKYLHTRYSPRKLG